MSVYQAADFFEAIKAGNLARVQELAADEPGLVNVRTEAGVSPALLAMYYDEPAIAEWLADRARPLTLHEAAALGNVDRVAEWLSAAPGEIDAYAPDGFTPMGLAAFFGRDQVVKLLLAGGADPARASRNGMHVMPLHSAVAGQHLEIARLLLVDGAPVDAQQSGGFTPLHAAAQNGDVATAGLLLDYCAADLPDGDGRTASELARAGGHEEVARLIESRVRSLPSR